MLLFYAKLVQKEDNKAANHIFSSSNTHLFLTQCYMDVNLDIIVRI